MAEKIDTSCLLAKVKDNLNKLDNCPKHFFDIHELPPLGKPLVCSNCGGEMGVGKVRHYIQGYVAAGGDYRDVYPNYYKEFDIQGYEPE